MYGKSLSLKGHYSSGHQAFDKALIAFTEAKKFIDCSKYYDRLAADLLTADTSESSRIEYLQNKISLGVRQYDFEGVARDINKVLELTKGKNDIDNEIKALNAIGINAAVKSDNKEAFKSLWLANEKSLRINYKLLTARTLINIGNIFSSLYN